MRHLYRSCDGDIFKWSISMIYWTRPVPSVLMNLIQMDTIWVTITFTSNNWCQIQLFNDMQIKWNRLFSNSHSVNLLFLWCSCHRQKHRLYSLKDYKQTFKTINMCIFNNNKDTIFLQSKDCVLNDILFFMLQAMIILSDNRSP